MSAGGWLRSVAFGLSALVLGLAVVTYRAVSEGEEHMRQSDRAFDRGDLPQALLEARSAAVMYAPGAPHVRAAYARLIAIAVGAEAAGQRRTAQAAWRAVRGAALETRHVVVPHAAELRRADENLARLAREGADQPESADSRATIERARKELERDDAPNAAWMGLLVAGFFLGARGRGLTGVRGVARDGKLTLGRAKLGLVLAALGVLCWTAAVWKA